MVFVKNCNFFHLFISGKIGHENELHDMLEENNACFDYKKTCEKVDKIGMFWKNLNFSTFLTSCFYGLESRYFVLQYRKTHFPGLYWLKKKVGKIAIFGPEPWVNPLGKTLIFRLFKLLVFCFPGLYCLKRKSWKNGYFWTKTMG